MKYSTAGAVGAVVAVAILAAIGANRLNSIEHRLVGLEQHLDQHQPLQHNNDVADAGVAMHGPADAPVVIVEFSDFDCPYCQQLQPTLERIRQHYGPQVRSVFRQFPLVSLHPNAWKAAEASLCADEQNKFLAMHAAMFDAQGSLDVASLQTMARRLGLDGVAFDHCLEVDRYHATVQADIDAGLAAGVDGTPTLFINGIPVVGLVPFEDIQDVIKKALYAAH